jgi:hypothetical protein
MPTRAGTARDTAACCPPTGQPSRSCSTAPDEKHGKNRVHLDLRTRDLEAEVSRVLALGATRLTDEQIEEHGWAWHILADPDGNEFCVLRPPPDYWAPSPG